MADEKETEKAKIVTNGEAVFEPIVIKLRNKIIANGDEVDELTFREPTAADIERVGNPVNIDMSSATGEVKVTFDSKAMTQMMSTLAAVPPSTIRQMKTKDWNSAAWSLASFFIPDL